MEQSVGEFFHDFRQETLAGAEASSTYQLEAFMDAVASELIETGFVEGFEHCHYRSQKGMRIDGYWFSDEQMLDVFIADFDCRRELEVLTASEITATLKRVTNFVEAAFSGKLIPDITTPEHGMIQEMTKRRSEFRRINVFLLSERTISSRFQDVSDAVVAGIPATFHIWDISRIQRQQSVRGRKEPLDINFVELFGHAIPCLRANLDSDAYQSYLLVMPATTLAELYDKFSSRLLEQNVRTYLQSRGGVNKGIQATILHEPHMFFAYNNGITATAQNVEWKATNDGLQITRMVDLQIVNGGQTTASLFHAKRNLKADLSQIYVQMKLSVIDSEQSESVVPRISEYANTQNRVNAADFFSNHPYHVRMAECSRRLWAPAQHGAQRETKWFYERARGQYLDEQSKLTQSQRSKFRAEYPKAQMFTKTDLAKYENVFDEHPRSVHHGSQKNFVRYATRIGSEWQSKPDVFNDEYFKRIVARAILFKATEKLVSSQSWYSGGYRANIVAYTLSMLGAIAERQKSTLDYRRIWTMQDVHDELLDTLAVVAKFVNDSITQPPSGFSNVSEWCKRDGCWNSLLELQPKITAQLPPEFTNWLVPVSETTHLSKSAITDQRISNEADAQALVLKVGAATWKSILTELKKVNLLTEKEREILVIACQIPKRLPSPKQCKVLLEIYQKAIVQGIAAPLN